MTGRRVQAPAWLEQLRSDRRAWAAAAALLFLAAWGSLAGGGRGTRWSPGRFPCSRPDGWWERLQSNLSAEVATAGQSGGWEVVFLGDSLIEALRGTSRGVECERCAGVPEVFARHVGAKHRAGALGIAGDQTTHLMFRLAKGGELPQWGATNPKLVALLIGTNDVGSASDLGEKGTLRAVDSTVARMQQIVRLLQRRLERTQIVILALLPRGNPNPAARYAQPAGEFCAAPSESRAQRAQQPGAASKAPVGELGPEQFVQPSLFSKALAVVNERYRQLAASSGARVHYIDCAGPLLLDKSREIDRGLMPDALHPNAAGYELLFSRCWDAALGRILGSTNSTAGG